MELVDVAAKGLNQPSEDLLAALKKARVHSVPFVGGGFVSPLTDQTFDNVTPINGHVVNRVASCGEADIDRAVKSARAAFEHGSWSRMAPGVRKRALLKFADRIEHHADELALLDAVDVGKPFEAARGVDLNSALNTVRWYAEAIDKVYGEVAPTAAFDIVTRQPVGVVGAVVPWNYPLMIAAWKFGPILAAGNSIVVKPAEQSPLSLLRIAEIAMEAGIPEGVFNVVPGLGPTAGAALGRHPGVSAIAFTGSAEVGKMFLGYAAQSSMKQVSLECGGKAPCIIAADADVKEAVKKLASGLFYNAGQSCNAPARIIAHRHVYEDVVQLFKEEAASYSPNHPLNRTTKVGAVVSKEQLSHIEGLVRSGVHDGAEIVVGGSPCFESSGGFYYQPTVMSGVRLDMQMTQNEIFGPVAPIERFETIDEALTLANGTPYGLWAYVWTRDLKTATSLARGIDAGTVAVNNVFGGDITTPLGGFKESGTGRDRSLHALYKYTQVKHMHFNV